MHGETTIGDKERYVSSGKSHLLALITVFLLGICLFFLFEVRQFLNSSGLSLSALWTNVSRGIEKSKEFQNKTMNVILFGLDARDDAYEQTLLTDAMLFISVNPKQGKITFIPIPRDLWINTLKTKANALYYYGSTNGLGVSYANEQISQLIHQPIDYYAVLDYGHLEKMIDMIGGIDVRVDRGFIDEEFPNPDFVAEKKESSVSQYIRVEFPKGVNHFDGKRALQFIRSRKSNDVQEGNDRGRSERQIKVLHAMLSKLMQPSFFLYPRNIGSLYRFIRDTIETNIEDDVLVGILLALLPQKNLAMGSHPIPLYDAKTGEGILVNPPIEKYNLWVYEPVRDTWEPLQRFVREVLQ